MYQNVFQRVVTSIVSIVRSGGGRLYTVGLQDARSVINYNTLDDNLLYPGEPTTAADRYTALNAPGTTVCRRAAPVLSI